MEYSPVCLYEVPSYCAVLQCNRELLGGDSPPSLLPLLHGVRADLHELLTSGPREVAAIFSACAQGPFSAQC